MENNKGQSIFLSVVGIATLLVAIVGATFAYFSINVTGNETASSIRVTTAIPGGVTFADGDDIFIENTYPGWSDTKTFTVNSDADANGTIAYELWFDVSTDGVTKNLATVAAAKDDFVYTMTSTETTGTGGTVVPAVTTATDMPADDQKIGDGILNGASNLHTYVMTIQIPEKDTAQDELQGAQYKAVLKVVVDTDEGKRTYDPAAPGWTTWTDTP